MASASPALDGAHLGFIGWLAELCGVARDDLTIADVEAFARAANDEDAAELLLRLDHYADEIADAAEDDGAEIPAAIVTELCNAISALDARLS
jgi:hypothetical protein